MATVAGVDTHLDTFTVAVCNRNGKQIFDQTFDNTHQGWSDALGFGLRHDVDVWAIEGTGSYGRCLTDHLTACAVTVFEVPTRRTVKNRKRVGRSKSDLIDAVACARAYLEAPLGPVTHIAQVEAVRVLLKWREALVHTQTQTINRIKARIREIDPAKTKQLELTSYKAWRALESFPHGNDLHAHAVGFMVRTEAHTCGERLRLIRSIEKQISNELPPAGQALCDEIMGIGAIGAAAIVAEVGDVTRFPKESKFAMWAAAAPLDASSGNGTHFRYNPGGNRVMDCTLETAIRTQLSHDGQAVAYIERRHRQGDTNREAFRSLKRQLARKVYRIFKQHQNTNNLT